jgi:hypothetical protein
MTPALNGYTRHARSMAMAMPSGVAYRLRQLNPANCSIVITFRENRRRQTTLTARRARLPNARWRSALYCSLLLNHRNSRAPETPRSVKKVRQKGSSFDMPREQKRADSIQEVSHYGRGGSRGLPTRPVSSHCVWYLREFCFPGQGSLSFAAAPCISLRPNRPAGPWASDARLWRLSSMWSVRSDEAAQHDRRRRSSRYPDCKPSAG